MAYTAADVNKWYNAVQYKDGVKATVDSFVALLNAGTLTPAQVQTAIIDEPYTTNYVNPVVRMYQAAFNRVPDSATSANSWVQKLAAGTATTTDMGNWFANTTEFQTTYGVQAASPINAATLTAFYQNILQRSPDAAGLDFWLKSGKTTGEVLSYFNMAPEYQTNAKTPTTTYQQAEIAGTQATSGSLWQYGGGSGTTYTLTTNIDTATATTFFGTASGNGGAVQASTTLNPGDNLTGTPGSTNSAINLTLANVGASTTFGTGATFNGIKKINVTAVGALSALDLSLATGYSELNSVNSSVALTLQGLQALAPVTLQNSTANTTVNFADGIVTSAATGTLNLNTVGTVTAPVAAVLIGGTNAAVGFGTLQINATGKNYITSLTTSNDTDLKTIKVSGAGDVFLSASTAAGGAGATQIATVDLSGSTGTNVINISQSSGATSGTIGRTTVTGGSGNDTVIFGQANLTTADVIDLKAGVNTLGIEYVAAAAGVGNTLTAAVAAGVNAAANVQKVGFYASTTVAATQSTMATIDLGLLNDVYTDIDLTGFGGVFANGAGAAAGNAVALTGVRSAEAINVKGDIAGLAGAAGAGGAAGAAAAAAVSLAATAPFQTAVLKLTADASDLTGIQVAGGAAGAGQASGSGVGGAGGAAVTTLTNISTLAITSDGSTVANSITGGAAGNGGAGSGSAIGGAAGVAINNAAGLNVTVAGGYDLNLVGGAAGSAGASSGAAGGARAYGFAQAVNVDASAFTGKLNVEGSNVITAGDVIKGGLGNDTINGSGGADYLDVSLAGADIIEYLTGTASEMANTAGGTAAQLGALTDAASLEYITGFATGTDKVRLNTSAAFFDAGGAQVTFTTGSTANVANVSVGNITAANVQALFTAINAAVTGTASTAAVAQAYLVTTGTVSGGLANASNATFLVVNDGAAAISQNDMIVKLAGGTSIVGADFTFGTV